jgi:AAA+ ATPase superfamily predicted ATPase
MIARITARIASFPRMLGIKSSRPFAYIPPYLNEGEKFFNRHQEMKFLKSTFLDSKDDTIFLLLGQPNCGKSRLINEFLNVNSDYMPSLRVDLRNIRLRTTTDLFNEMERKLTDNLQGFVNYLTRAAKCVTGELKCGVSTPSIGNAKVDAGIRVEVSGEKLVEALKKDIGILEKMGIMIEEFKKLYTQGLNSQLVFCFDEINRMKEIMHKEMSREDFRSLIALLVLATKQNKNCKVLFGTTDSSFVGSMQEMGFSSGWFLPFSMGNLPF